MLVEAMNALARSAPARQRVGWPEYSANSDPHLAELDEAIFEMGHLFSGAIPAVDTVWRAIDLEATRAVAEPADVFGTRHRSVFRLCGSRPDVLAIVVSQDGQARFVKTLGDRVVYFDHGVLGTL